MNFINCMLGTEYFSKPRRIEPPPVALLRLLPIPKPGKVRKLGIG